MSLRGRAIAKGWFFIFDSSAAGRTGPCGSSKLTTSGDLLEWISAERAASLGVVLALVGAALLGTSELADRLEPMFGLNALNLVFALPIAALAVIVVAVTGDEILAARERRVGRRLDGLRLLALTIPGLAGTVAISVAHLGRPPALDASLGLAGGVLLLLAAGLYRHAIRPVRHPSRPRA
jgi:hypothetical protein